MITDVQLVIRFLKKLSLSLVIALLFIVTPSTALAAELYPDLLTIPPSEIQYDRVDINGEQKNVLRFTNTVWNGGRGILEMYGTTTPEGQTQVTQRVHDDSGGHQEHTSGNFVWHEAHNHWHFENFAMYELWNRSDFEAWDAGGREGSGSATRSFKTTFCIRETQLIHNLEGTPSSPIHTECGNQIQGLSVGWGDSYRYDLPEQWIEIGNETLPDGDYTLRSVADPENRIKESPDDDPYYDGHKDNEAVTNFSVHEGEIITETEPETPL